MTGSELQGLDQFIETLLGSDLTLQGLLGGPGKVFQEVLPQGFVLPGVTYGFVSSPDINVVGHFARAATRPLYQIYARTKSNNFSQAHLIHDRFDKLLMGANGQIPASNLFISGTYREEPLRYVEVDASGIRYSHLGGRYRFWVSGITG